MRRTMVSGCVVLLWSGACLGRAIMVTGRVVDDRARPVTGAEVAVVENDPEWNAGLREGRLGGPIARTDERGSFEVKADVEFVRDMFVVAHKAGLALAWDRAPFEASSASHLHFHLVMEKPAALAGSVVDGAGRGVARAKVRAVPRTCYLSRLNQSPIFLPEVWLSTQTDAEGCFRFDAFSADVTCTFWVQAEDHRCTHGFTTNYLPGFGYEVGRPDIRLVLPREHRVAGRVVEQGTGKPVAGVDLEISRPRDRRQDIAGQCVPYRVRADANGVFVFPGVPEGEHQIELARPAQGLGTWVAKPLRVSVGPENDVGGLTLEVDAGGIVEILVRDARTQEALAGMCVSLPGLSRSELPRTDSKGMVRARLLPGESHVLISAGIGENRRYQGWGLGGSSRRFIVPRGETVRVEADLEPANRIRGTVVDPNGKAVAGATVRIHPLSTGSTIITNIGDTLCTDANGGFELGCGEADPTGWYVTVSQAARGLAGVAEITSLDQPLTIALAPGVTVQGTVVAQDGPGIPAARVTVLTHVSGTVSNVAAETLCDAGGAFSLPAVLPTDAAITHRLCVDASGYGPKSYRDIAVAEKAGATTDLGKIALPAATESLAGVVVDVNDRPAAGIPVFLHSSGREVSQPQKFTAADAGGRFRFDRICKGPAHLQANFSNSLEGWASTKTESGRQDIRLVLQPGEGAARLAARMAPGPPDYVRLTGKQLGQVKSMESLLPPEVANKPLLLLFMDQQQRPSRRVIVELAKRADLLREKGIEVLLVQTAPLERADLDRWLAEQKAPFRTQVLPGGFEKQRYTWGVQALPWLVLADRDRVVRAEGFAPEELEQKIASLAGAETPKATEAETSRVVHFPKEVSLGQLRIRDRGASRWQDWGAARGDVAVPFGKELRLSLHEAFAHRARLASLAPDDLQELDLSSRELADADLECLKGLTGLESLFLGGTYAGPCPLTGRGLVHLRGMTELRSLMLDFTSVTDDQLAHLAPLQALETLQLHRNRYLTGDGLVHLQGLKSLRDLRFYVTPLEDDGLKHIALLTSLEKLSLQSTHVTDAGLAHLEKLTRLRDLVLPDQISDEGLVHAGKLAALERLFLYSDSITDAGLAHLKSLSSLNSLILCSPKVTRKGIEPLLAVRPALKLELSLHFTTDAEAVCLKELPYVTSLSLARSQISDAALAPLADLASLHYLNLSRTAVTDAGLLPLENLHAVDNLDLDGTRIGDEGLAHLRHLTALDTLRLHGTRVTDAGLAHLAGMKSLTMLFLGSTDVTDAGLVHLKDMPKLVVLFLRYTKVTGPGLAHLTGLTSLRDLDLTGAPLQDAAVAHLKQMKHLQTLSINTAGMSEGAVEELRRALPDCIIRVSKN